MQAVVVAVLFTAPGELLALAAVARGRQKPPVLVPIREPQIPEVVVVAVDIQPRQYRKANPAAPASSSSNTKSPAQPRSLPSSHRRSGLHLLAR